MESIPIDPAALKLALEAIRRRDRFTAEIAELLESRGHESPPILDYLTGRGFVNDERIAAAEVDRLTRRGWGPEKIRADLSRRGAPDSAIDAALSAGSPRATGLAALQKRFGSNAGDAETLRIKAIRFLLSRGFESEIAEEATEDFLTH